MKRIRHIHRSETDGITTAEVFYTLYTTGQRPVVYTVSNHIISVKDLRRPEDYADIFVILEENRIINKNFSSRLQEMTKFRNFLVHRYALVDRNKLFKTAKEDVKDIIEFIKTALKLIR